MNEKKNIFLKNMKQMRMGAIASALGFAVYLISRVAGLDLVSGIIAIAVTAWSLYVLLSALMYEGEDMTRSFTWGQSALTVLMAIITYGTVRQWLGL